jgi:hypothetical protein
MTTDEKFQALQALVKLPSHVSITRRNTPTPWYVSLKGVGIVDHGFYMGIVGGGATPEKAIEVAWNELTNLSDEQYIRIEAQGVDHRAVIWNGFMWAPVQEKD